MRLAPALAFASLAIAAPVACASHPTVPEVSNFAIAVGQSDSVRGAGLSIKFIRVNEDSRCPLDVQCIWAGNAQVELEALSGGVTTTVVLNTGEGAREMAVNSYLIRLLELTPAPTAGIPIPQAAYKATLSLTRPGSACTEEARPALTVTLTDSVSGDAVSRFTGVSAVAQAGAYMDSVAQSPATDAPFNRAIGLAYERAGTYTVRVRAEGYALWTRSGVVVTKDECHVVTVGITARLAR